MPHHDSICSKQNHETETAQKKEVLKGKQLKRPNRSAEKTACNEN